MAGAGSVIIFVCAFVAFTISTLLYLLFASHYFLVTVIDSSAGHDEVHYPDEGLIDWWWKPIFCLWILGFWVITGSILLSPLAALGPKVFAIALGLLLWFVYPLGILSALYTQNWLFFLHPVILWRMLKHYLAFAYVHLITALAVSVCAALIFGAFTHSFIWALPAALLVPAAQLFCARNWGRFAWLSLNFVPRVKKPPRSPSKILAQTPVEDAPEMEVQEVDETEGVREGLPPACPGGIKAGAPGSPEKIAATASTTANAAQEEDEWAVNKNPYKIADDPALRPFEETAAEPVSVPASPPPAPVVEEEEDEWATNKKPYGVIEDPPPTPASANGASTQSDANKPVTNSHYYDERAKTEKAANQKAKREAAQNFMPTPSKKTPTFQTALFFGVWKFMFEPRTLGVWVNLVFLTVAELFFLFMVVRFWPNLE